MTPSPSTTLPHLVRAAALALLAHGAGCREPPGDAELGEGKPGEAPGDMAPDDDPPTPEPDPQPDPGDPPGRVECAPDRIDLCPADRKCTAVVDRSGTRYEYQCVPDKGELGPGEACMPAPPTGVDGCPSGFACIPDTFLIPTEGHCLRLCGSDDACDVGVCAIRPTSPVPVCATRCNPLLVECPATEACRLLDGRAFGCITPLPDDIGVQGQPCDSLHQLGCANGFVCIPSFQVPDCLDADACCTALCAVPDADDPGEPAAPECPGLATCQPFAGDGWPLADAVGLCIL